MQLTIRDWTLWRLRPWNMNFYFLISFLNAGGCLDGITLPIEATQVNNILRRRADNSSGKNTETISAVV